MVANPLCAEPWQPLSLRRQATLANSLSYLPLGEHSEDTVKWQLISEFHLARYLGWTRQR